MVRTDRSRRAVSASAKAALSFVVLCGAGANVVMAAPTLCAAGEAVVFSCSVANKTVSLCRPSGDVRQLVYRYGRPGHLELVHAGGGGGAGGFTLSTEGLSGGGIDTVTFERGNYSYSLYSKVSRGGAGGSGSVPEFEDGLTVRRGTTIAKTAVCDDGGGFSEPLDWLPRVDPKP